MVFAFLVNWGRPSMVIECTSYFDQGWHLHLKLNLINTTNPLPCQALLCYKWWVIEVVVRFWLSINKRPMYWAPHTYQNCSQSQKLPQSLNLYLPTHACKNPYNPFELTTTLKNPHPPNSQRPNTQHPNTLFTPTVGCAAQIRGPLK